MTLQSIHFDYLRARGVSDEIAARIYQADGGDLLVPCRDPQTGKVYRIKSDDQALNGKPYVIRRPLGGGAKVFYAPKGGGCRPYFSPLMAAGALDRHEWPLVFVEGPIKADSCTANIPEGFAFVALNGVFNWLDHRDESGTSQPTGSSSPLAELKGLPLAGRRCIVLFDSDIIHNPTVSDAAKKLGNWLHQRGAHTYKVTLPAEPNGAKNGPDDFIVRHGADALREMLLTPARLGLPFPAALLRKDNGSIRGNLDAEEVKLALLSIKDEPYDVQDHALRALATSTRTRYDVLQDQLYDLGTEQEDTSYVLNLNELGVDDEEAGYANVIVPGLLDRGESLILAGDAGIGKSLLFYSLIEGLLHGAPFLGIPLPRRKVLLLQIEEPAGTRSTRLRAIGAPSATDRLEVWTEFQWESSRWRRRLESYIDEHKPDLLVIDSLRAIAGSVDLNTEVSGKVVRPLAQLMKRKGVSLLLIHHSTYSRKVGGDSGLKGAVDRTVCLELPEGADPEGDTPDRVLTAGKNRTGRKDSLRMKLELEYAPGRHQDSETDDPEGWRFVVKHKGALLGADLSIPEKATQVLYEAAAPMSVSDVGEVMGLPRDGTKANKTLRNAFTDPVNGLKRWKVPGSQRPQLFWIPPEERPEEFRSLAYAFEDPRSQQQDSEETSSGTLENPEIPQPTEHPCTPMPISAVSLGTSIEEPSSSKGFSSTHEIEEGPKQGPKKVLTRSQEGEISRDLSPSTAEVPGSRDIYPGVCTPSEVTSQVPPISSTNGLKQPHDGDRLRAPSELPIEGSSAPQGGKRRSIAELARQRQQATIQDHHVTTKAPSHKANTGRQEHRPPKTVRAALTAAREVLQGDPLQEPVLALIHGLGDPDAVVLPSDGNLLLPSDSPASQDCPLCTPLAC